MAKSKKAYVRAPRVPLPVKDRYEAVLSVLSGQTTVSEAARRLGLSRLHFQTVMHRGLARLIEGLVPGQPGRPAQSPEAISSKHQIEHLLRENRKLRGRVETIERLLGVASGLLKGKVKPMTRSRSRRTTSTRSEETSDDDELSGRLDEADAMTGQGLPARLVAAATGTSQATLRRWRRRRRMALPLRRHRGPRPLAVSSPVAEESVRDLVRQMHGLCGAASLSRSVSGVSRRRAASLKNDTLRVMEVERRASCERIVVARPGVLRGFDQLHLPTSQGAWFALVSADGHVPYRTSLTLTAHYDGESVARAITKDFETNGPPLVWRADRARSHETPAARAVLKRFGVLVLHGPPRLPRFYGQLERQNREHRAWLEGERALPPAALAARCHDMIASLNTLWRRPTLGWKTAAEVWNARATLDVDRAELHRDVQRRTARLRRRLDPRTSYAGLAERLAIEQALTERGLLCRFPGGWC